ncbi:MAG: hypothetical protein QG599_3006 [Pseudomonadota bacterium]|nr:hypothetical protein [Pseudomonadota bacterium]
MSDRTRRLQRLALFMLSSLLVAGGAEAQSYRSYRGSDEGPPARSGPSRPPARQFADPDRAANAAREATGGRVLGVQGADRDGRPGYKVRVLEPGGRVRNFHYDPPNGRD